MAEDLLNAFWCTLPRGYPYITAPVTHTWLMKDPVICTRPVSKRSGGQLAQSARAGTRVTVATPEYWPTLLVLMRAGNGAPVITWLYWLWDFRLVDSMERADAVRWVSQTSERRTLLPCNPDGLHTPRDQVSHLVAGPGVLASPMRHSALQKELKRRKIQSKNLGALKLWFTCDGTLSRLPGFHSCLPFLARMVSSLLIWSSNMLDMCVRWTFIWETIWACKVWSWAVFCLWCSVTVPSNA